MDFFINRGTYIALAKESISSFCFFRKSVNDLFTDRSIELALNEVCIISEFSNYQENIFRDKVECYYFKNHYELNKLMNFVCNNRDKAKNIGLAARRRALELKLTSKNLALDMIKNFYKLSAQ